MSRLIALYLPQFHAIPENDAWWGKGFTEWTNVRRAKPSFKGHVQPKVPGELGYYNLLDADIKQKQADLAREAGIEGFCYYHYWFGLDEQGKGKQLLEKPLQQVVESGKPDYPFCLCWANHTWSNKTWEKSSALVKEQVLMAQEYGGIKDYTEHFYSLLSTFKDARYMRVDGRLLFFVYDTVAFKDAPLFISTWRQLAEKESLPGFYFVGMTPSTLTFHPQTGSPCLPNLKSSAELFEYTLRLGFDAVNSNGKRRGEMLSIGRLKNLINRVLTLFHITSSQNYDYARTAQGFFAPEDSWENVYPTVIPQWDRTARVGRAEGVYIDATPEKWSKHLKQALGIVAHKHPEHQIIVIKSWNEWAEGNYLEPDQRYGRGWLEATKQTKKK
ncbi:MAG: glycoside hydrolase family 99-like domain-containing protein [Paludibacteraceae bacterium]|nr:glycoside hydrolase family 99-like domain-containing protein [Paludibacteraceae bacterium]